MTCNVKKLNNFMVVLKIEFEILVSFELNKLNELNSYLSKSKVTFFFFFFCFLLDAKYHFYSE